jgi:hypothetical protein
MKKIINVPKYIQKLKKAKLPQYMVGQEDGLALRDIIHPGIYILI